MSKKSGVILYLPPRTRIPHWIGNRGGVKIETRCLEGGHQVRSLSITGGEAMFVPGGGVDVKIPRCGDFRYAFLRLRVLEIRDLAGELLKRNHFLCIKCFENSGVITAHRPNLERASLENVWFQCSRCNHTWMLEGI